MIDPATLKGKLIVGGVVSAILAAIFSAQQLKISWLKDDIQTKNATISTLNGDLAVSEANVATLKASVERQNTAIQQLQAQKATLDAKVRESALRAQKNRAASVSIEGEGVDSMNQFFERLFK